MARQNIEGEKPLFWVGSSRDDLLEFPVQVRREIGNALGVAQFGGKHPAAKPWKGEGGGVFEVVEDFDKDTIGPSILSNILGQFMYYMRFKKSRQRE